MKKRLDDHAKRVICFGLRVISYLEASNKRDATEVYLGHVFNICQ